VEGTESSPVGYLEGVFVEAAYRRQGIARELVKVCQKFAKEQGCTEFASDCELDNEDSLQFHLKMGFEEASRNIHFAKKI
jgi:aminoglycoside 6'-N-acetyltransferase I